MDLANAARYPKCPFSDPVPLIRHFSFRPEINGLRAIAVLAVVFYHAGLGCPGGYVGVDVFFVISGFLISSLIWKDLEKGTFTFAGFWERRFRRIGPALIAVVLAVLFVGYLVMLPEDLSSMGRAAASQALFLANIHYWMNTGYFVGTAEEKPLLHTWSLAVEEQFYLIAPIALWGLYRSKTLNNRLSVLALLGGGFFASLGMSELCLARFPGATFYLLPTRAWELLLGALTAFLPRQGRLIQTRLMQEIIHIAGLALILISIFLYSSQTRFPGLAALPPTVGTAILLWANAGSDHRTSVTKMMTWPPMLFVGLISYSLYLWHWPLLAFSKYLSPAPLTGLWRGGILIFGFGCAVLSWKFVETPFRERRFAPRPRTLWVSTATSLASIFALGILCWGMQGFPHRFSPQMQSYARARSDTGLIIELTTEDIAKDRVPPIGVRDLTVHPTVLVWGDSHAMAALPAIDQFLKENGLSGRAITHSSTAPVLGWYVPSSISISSGLDQESIPFGEAVIAYVTKHKITSVILIGCWSGYLGHDSISNPLRTALLKTVQRLNDIGTTPWIMLDVPIHAVNIPKALSLSANGQALGIQNCARPSEQDELGKSDPELLTELEAAGARILDPKPLFLNEAGDRYIFQKGETLLYRDANHLTSKGALLMLTPLLRRNFHPDHF